MSLNVTIYGPRHFFWRSGMFAAWFFHPDSVSTGGIGFKVPFLQVAFYWGYKFLDGPRA